MFVFLSKHHPCHVMSLLPVFAWVTLYFCNPSAGSYPQDQDRQTTASTTEESDDILKLSGTDGAIEDSATSVAPDEEWNRNIVPGRTNSTFASSNKIVAKDFLV